VSLVMVLSRGLASQPVLISEGLAQALVSRAA
jgi:hypothetical protein